VEALRASEHVARGQLEAFTTTLSALAQESDPDKLLEHVLRMIARQSDAQSVSVWTRNDDDCLGLAATFEDDRLQVPSDEASAAQKTSLNTRDHPVWSEMFRTGTDCAVGELDHDPPRIRLENREERPWHPWHGNAAYDPTAPPLSKRLVSRGVVATLTVPMVIAGRVAGAIGIGFQQKRSFRPEEMELTRLLAHQAMMAIQLMRLSRQSREAAVVAERNRMARDIHDTLAQGFTGIIVQLEATKGSMARNDLADATERVGRVSDLARSSLGEARRSVRALRPRSLGEGTLAMALGDLLKRMTQGTGLQAHFQVEGQQRPMPAHWEEALRRIVQEALTNTIRHGQARTFRATLSSGAQGVQLRLSDDGRGFDARAEHDGFGLMGMKERVEQLGGRFTLRSHGGQGTEILVELESRDAESRSQT
jgi:signal transduction histidine kinase